MTNITELKMNVNIIISDKKIGNIDITISDGILYIIQIKKIDKVLYLDNFIDVLLEEMYNIKRQFKCKKISFSLLQNSENVTKNDILNYIANQYY